MSQAREDPVVAAVDAVDAAEAAEAVDAADTVAAAVGKLLY
jgi:hypothetical protein